MKTILSLRGAVFFSAVLIISLFILSASSFAATFTVTNLNDSGAGSLRQAILDANTNMGPDDIVFAFGVRGAIFLHDMEITDDVTITGPGANRLTLDAMTNGNIFKISDGDLTNKIVVSINGLRFINTRDGSAIVNEEELSIGSCVFEDNEGGAIRNVAGVISEITKSTFIRNTAFQGGAIFNSNVITAITKSTFSWNTAYDDGGAIYSTNNPISMGTIEEITNSTFSNNSAKRGGAIFNATGSTIRISFTTIANNEGDQTGGILNDGILNIKNSIVGDNIGDNCGPAGTFTAIGVNLDTDGTCPGFTQVTSTQLNLDPDTHHDALKDNGGPTETIELISPSAAMDAIALMDCADVDDNAVTTDQRIFQRPFPMGGSCDVGAFEANPQVFF